MRFFLDTANIREVEIFNNAGLLDGVTTNPSLIAKSGQDIIDTIKKMANIVKGTVSAEIIASDFNTMMEEAEKLASIASNVSVKVPLTPDGLLVCKKMSSNGVAVNATLCFTVSQALLAAKAGATFISPFIGRLEEVGENGIDLVKDIVDIYKKYPDVTTSIMASSIRSVEHVQDAARVGADVATIPPKIFREMFGHPLTDQGIKIFTLDWQKSKQNII